MGQIKGIISNQKGILIPYKDVVQKLNIPPEYLVTDIYIWETFVKLHLVKKAEINFDLIHKYDSEEYYLKVRKEKFIQKFHLENLENGDFYIDILVKNKDSTIIWKIGHLLGEDLAFYLEKDYDPVYFWVYKKDSDKEEKFFVYTGKVEND